MVETTDNRKLFPVRNLNVFFELPNSLPTFFDHLSRIRCKFRITLDLYLIIILIRIFRRKTGILYIISVHCSPIPKTTFFFNGY